MLDRLSQVITPQEDAAVRQIASDASVNPSLLDVRMHRCVAGLLVGHGITTWNRLRACFPGERLPVNSFRFPESECSATCESGGWLWAGAWHGVE